MLKEAYSLIMEILSDEQLNQFVRETTGKNLAIINAGAQVTTPAAIVSFYNGVYTRASNTNSETSFRVSFALPFWGANAFDKCLDFLDFVIPVFFEYKSRANFVKSVTPSVIEQDNEQNFWNISINVIVEVFV